MDVSTPVVPSGDLRRRTILQQAGSNLSPLRRSINPATFNNSLLEISNDENERSVRRSNAEMQRKLSNISQEKTPLNESYIKEQFSICTHLFTENKITTKNAWKLQIIDILKPLLSHKASKDNLQVASTSIDISAKVYGIRVDDIHSDGLKLASNMARVSEKQTPHDAEEENSDGDDNDENKEKQAGGKKKKKKRSTGQKTTVTNIKATLAPLPMLEPVDFTARVNAETGAIDNLFTNVLKEDHSSITFAFLDKNLTLFSDEDPLVQNIADNTTPISILPSFAEMTNIRLNQPFADFKLDEWDPDQEEQLLNAEKSMQSQNHPEIVFDEQGIPIPELDGSIPDLFENNDNVDDDNDIEFIHEQIAPQLRGEVAHIVDFRSVSNSLQVSEYSYNTIVNTHTGNFIDQIWAGPCHWKLKFIRRNTTRFTGARTELAPVKQKRKRAPPEMLTYLQPVEIDWSKRLVIRKRPPTADINKITLPLRYNMKFDETIDDLMLKPGVRIIDKKKMENLDYEVGPYKYENPNDSLYCSQQHDDNGAGDGDDSPFGDNFGDEHEERAMAEQQGFLGENLVDAPETVPESYIPYAMKAKQMDMKKLKAAIWQRLTDRTDLINREPQQSSVVVNPILFSKMYTSLPEILAEKEKKELTCPLAFVALLHLCNEQNLYLDQLSGYKDFEIRGSK